MALTRIENNQISNAVSGNTQVGINGNIKLQEYSVGGSRLANNLNYGSDFTVTGNTVSGNIATGGLVSATGNVTGGNIFTAGVVSATGNVIGNYFLGNIACATGYNSNTIYNGTSNVLIATANGNITMSVDGTPNVVVVTSNTLQTNNFSTSGNAIIGGDLVVNGNLTYVNVTDLNVEDPIIGLGRGPNNAPLTTDDGKDRGEQLWYYAGSEKSAFTGYDNSAGKILLATDVTITNEIVAVNNYGNLVIGNLEGASSSVTGTATAGNVLTGGVVSAAGTGTFGNVATGGTISATGTATVGNLATAGTVSATGNVTGGNLLFGSGIVSGTGNIYANNIFANISGNIDAAGSNTEVQFNNNDLLAASANFTFNSATNTLTVSNGDIVGGNLSTGGTVSATGNITGGNVRTAGLVSATGNVYGSWFVGNVDATIVSATGNVTGGNLLTGGVVSSAGTVTGGNLATAGTVTATGTITGGNVLTGGIISATGTIESANNITGANLFTSGVVSAGANITGGNVLTGGIVSATGTGTFGNVNTAGDVSATGSLTGGNIFTGGVVSAVSTVTGGNLATAGTVTATGTITGGNVLTGGIISATGTGTFGNVNTAGAISATGNINGGNIISGNAVVGNIDVSGNVIVNSLTSNTTVSASGTITGGNLATGGTVSSTGTITGGNIATGGTVSASGNITGNYFFGNGSQLTGIDTNLIKNGSSNVRILSANGNISMDVNGTSNVVVVTQTGVDVTGTVSSSGNVTGGNLFTGGLISATGNVIASNVITATVTTASGDLKLEPVGNIVLGNRYINGVAYPFADQDAASKIYVDNLVSTAISYHEAVLVATTTTLAATTGGTITYNQPNGAGNGIGATLTTTGSFNLIDTANVQTANTRILVKNEANATHNGIYVWSNATVITRSSDADTAGVGNAFALGLNDYFFVSGGNINLGSAYIVDAPTGAITFGTSNIEFAQFSQSQVYSANTSAGLLLIGQQFNAKVDNNTTAFDLGGNISIKAGANLTTPNIGAATGTSLSVTGTVTGGNITTAGVVSATGNVTGNYFIGNGSQLTGVTASSVDANNLTGNTLSSNVIFSSLTTVGTLTSLSVSGTTTTGNLDTGGTVSASGTVTGGNLATAGTITATGTITGGNVLTAGIVSATGDVTGGNIATAGTITATGTITSANTITGGNVLTGGIVSAAGTVTGGNVLTGGIVSATSTITGGNVLTAGDASAGGSLTGGNIFTGGTVSATSTITGGNLATAGTVTATGTITGGNVLTGGIISATGTATVGNVLTGGLISATGTGTFGNVNTAGVVSATGNITGNYFFGNGSQLTGIDTNLIKNGDSNVRILTANGNISMDVNGTSNVVVVTTSGMSVTGNVQSTQYTLGANAVFGSSLTATTGATVAINATDSVLIPVGNTVQRPTGVTGMLRFNTTTDKLEIYDSNSWEEVGATVFTVIGDQQFAGDDSTVTFVLSDTQTTNSCIVSINGVVQIPGTAYSVTGTNLTFTEAPLAGDDIDVRKITTTTTVIAIQNSPANASITVNDTSNVIAVTGQLQGAGNVLTVQGDLSVTGNVNITGNIATNQINNGTSAVQIPVASGNVNIDVGAVDNMTVFTSTGVFVNGNVSVTGNVTAQDVNSLSDVTLKTNIQPISGIESVLFGLNGYEYDWKNGSGHSYGFLAQEVEKVLPNAVKTGADGLKAINYMMIIPFLVETIKQMGAEIKDLKQTVIGRDKK
jgi:fibronectin-binding autotransporter adhesin